MSPLPERMANHWWWRPGCRPGRRQYAWHILLDDQPAARAAVRKLQAHLTGMAGLDLVPERWLHMTTHIVGFADEISDADAKAIAGTVADSLQAMAPVPVTFGRTLFHPEAVVLAARPIPALAPIREAAYRSAVQVLGAGRADGGGDWVPHVTAAYSNAEGPAQPVIEAAAEAATTCDAAIGQVHLVAQERIGHSYRWERVAAVHLGDGTRP